MQARRPWKCPPARILGLSACAISLVFLAGLGGCKTVDLEGAGPGPDTTDTLQGTAKLRITHKIDLEPDDLEFFLFPGDTPDFSNAANAKDIGSVAPSGTGVFTVPAGTWKLAFTNSTGVLTPMRDVETDEWVKAILEKDGDYSLILKSDGQDIQWDPTFETDPALQ
jgi:hypothetical protein